MAGAKLVNSFHFGHRRWTSPNSPGNIPCKTTDWIPGKYDEIKLFLKHLTFQMVKESSYLSAKDRVSRRRPSPRKIQIASLARQKESADLAAIGSFSSTRTTHRPTTLFASLNSQNYSFSRDTDYRGTTFMWLTFSHWDLFIPFGLLRLLESSRLNPRNFSGLIHLYRWRLGTSSFPLFLAVLCSIIRPFGIKIIVITKQEENKLNKLK